MNRIYRATVLGFALATSGFVAANASVPLPVIQQASGMPTLAPMLKKITPAVVGISIKSRASDGNARRQRDAKPAAADQQARAAGSGVIIDAGQGLVVTNNHVIDRADEITVQLADGRELGAKLVGGDPDTDIAVIKVAAENLTAIPVGNSDRIEVGDFVLAIGNPFLIGQTVTSGIVSGLDRTNVGLEQYEDFIQTDAAIYPGNSGGALVNLRGELIGINTAFVGATNSNPGMGFAIPVNMARVVTDRILEIGDVRRGKLGITFEDSTPALVREFKFAAAPATPIITKVDPGSPADLAGLKVGDVITDLAGTPARDMSHLRTRLGLLWVGDTAELTVMRNGKRLVIRATIADPPPAKGK
ncbi:MAG TPA: trypsin-like peptidase domain-containing protein [Xanthobacteraceae bacterium]|jgi:serine protease Do/serine protease DegQ|nr:trypsin-like peptidase domain-containing protein [Xanthobacteraceae bacterium]